jgi:hypothetical protein
MNVFILRTDQQHVPFDSIHGDAEIVPEVGRLILGDSGELRLQTSGTLLQHLSLSVAPETDSEE